MKRPGAQATWATLLRRIVRLRGYRPGMYLGDELPRIEQPTLVIWGEGDMAPAEDGRKATEHIPKANFEYMPGIGHFPFLETPEETARLIRSFVGAPGGKTLAAGTTYASGAPLAPTAR